MLFAFSISMNSNLFALNFVRSMDRSFCILNSQFTWFLLCFPSCCTCEKLSAAFGDLWSLLARVSVSSVHHFTAVAFAAFAFAAVAFGAFAFAAFAFGAFAFAAFAFAASAFAFAASSFATSSSILANSANRSSSSSSSSPPTLIAILCCS